MKNTVNFKLPHLLVISAITTIYFQIYWHYWLVKLLGGYTINTVLPILFLFTVFIIREFVSCNTITVKKRKIYYLLLPLFYYLFFASYSIILNEQGLGDIKRYLIYIYSPALIFVSIFGIHMYRKNKNIESTLKILFITGIIFSIYVAVIYSVNPMSIRDLPPIETSRGFELAADTGASFGIGDLSAIRYTIPGISSTTYGPLLVPLILVGLYIRKQSEGQLKYFYTLLLLFLVFCMFKTVSRGPILALIAGIIYLSWWRWFKLKEVIFIVLLLVISFLAFAKLSFLRILITIAALIPGDMQFLGGIVPDFKDPRLMSISDTLSYIYMHPFWGMGMSNLFKVQEFAYGKEHNNYLSIAASFGIITLMFYIAFIILLFVMLHKSVKKMPKNSSARDMGIVLGAGSLALIAYLNAAPAEFHFIWVWFGLAAGWARNCEIELGKRRLAE